MEAARRKEEEIKQQQLANATKGHLEENDHNEDDEMVNGDVSKDLSTDENIVDPIEDRRTLAERNERLQDQLLVRLLLYLTFFFQKNIVEYLIVFQSVSLNSRVKFPLRERF